MKLTAQQRKVAKEIKLGQRVSFVFMDRNIKGRVTSIEHGVANIIGDDQGKSRSPAYHVPLKDLAPLV